MIFKITFVFILFFEFLILLWDNFPINIFDNLHFINYFIEDLFKLSQKSSEKWQQRRRSQAKINSTFVTMLDTKERFTYFLLNDNKIIIKYSQFGHEFLEFEFRPDGKLRYANNSNYKNDTLIRKECYVSKSVMEELKRIIDDSEIMNVRKIKWMKGKLG